MLLKNFLILKNKTVDEIQQQILLMAKSQCLPFNSPLVGTICSGWPEFWRIQTYSILHGNLSHLIGNMINFLTYGLYFEYRHGALLTCLLIFGANFASLPIIFSAATILGASSGCFALLGAICVDVMAILNKTGYWLAWELKAQRISSCCFTLLLFLAQLLFLAFTLFFPISELTKLSGVQLGSEDGHLAGFVTGLLFGIVINCSNETKECGQKPIVPKWYRIMCQIILGIWVAFILGCNLLFLYRSFEIEGSVPLDAEELSNMVEEANDMNPDLKFRLFVNFCKAYKNEKYWMSHENSTQYLAAGQGVKRPAFCQPLAFIFGFLQLILALFAILFWKKCQMVVAYISANSKENAVAMDENGDAKKEQEESVV